MNVPAPCRGPARGVVSAATFRTYTLLSVTWTQNRELKYVFKFVSVLGRFSAQVGPRNVPNSHGLKNATQINKNEPAEENSGLESKSDTFTYSFPSELTTNTEAGRRFGVALPSGLESWNAQPLSAAKAKGQAWLYFVRGF